jgi:uncharacterized membrane protein
VEVTLAEKETGSPKSDVVGFVVTMVVDAYMKMSSESVAVRSIPLGPDSSKVTRGVPAAVGVPVMAPLAALRSNPAGRLAEVTAQVSEGETPTAASVCE